MMNKKALYVAVVATLGLVASGANAAVNAYGSELPAGSDFASNTWNTLVTAYAPTTANPLYLTFKLTNGASFNTLVSSSLVCTGVVAGASGVLTPANIQLAAGGAGTGFATFVVTAISAGGMMEGCTITNGTALVGTWPASVGETVSAVYGNALATPTTDSTSLYSASSLFSNTTNADTNTAMVATGFISFNTAFNTAAALTSTTARLGQFGLLLNSNLLSTGLAANQTAVTAIVSAITISLAGTPLAAASTKNSTGSIFITYNSSVAGGATCADTLLVSAAAGSTNITFTAVSPSPAAGATSGYVYAACMGVSGAVIPAGTITVGVAGVANTDPLNPNGSAYQIGSLIAAGTTIGTITHNGASTTVLNLPRGADTTTPATLRVYNTSNLAGAVSVTIYNQSGVAVASNCQLTSSLVGNGVLAMSVASIVSACSFTEPTSGRYRMDVVGAFPTMRAQAMALSNGVLTNIGGDTSTSNN
jgi:hypothetical protein